MEQGETNARDDESKADAYLCEHVLKAYYEEAVFAIAQLKKIEDSINIPLFVRNALIRRWEQIRTLIRSAFQNGINFETQLRAHGTFDLPPPSEG